MCRLSEIRSSYDFDDFKTEEYQNVRSIIKDEWSWSPRNSYDPAEVASFNKLSFTLVIGGFKVDEQFEKLGNGFYQKWGESEFIEKLDGRSITDRTIWFKKKSGGSVPIVLKFSLDPYTYDVAGAISLMKKILIGRFGSTNLSSFKNQKNFGSNYPK